jgi:hypothetical protein
MAVATSSPTARHGGPDGGRAARVAGMAGPGGSRVVRVAGTVGRVAAVRGGTGVRRVVRSDSVRRWVLQCRDDAASRRVAR